LGLFFMAIARFTQAVLANTGSTASLLTWWAAGGVLLLGIAFVSVRVIVHRQGNQSGD
jgi:LPXTG-motif cell wall-anchored protein